MTYSCLCVCVCVCDCAHVCVCVCVCSTKTCPTTGWTGWAYRPPCTETRTAPGPCRRCTSTMGPSCTRTSTRTRPTPTPCPPAWAPRLTTLSREIKTPYTGRCKPPVRGGTKLSGGQACIQAGMVGLGWGGQSGESQRRSAQAAGSLPGTAGRYWSPKCCTRR